MTYIMTYIDQLPRGIKELAELRQSQKPWIKGDNFLGRSFIWDLTPEGHNFWQEISNGNFTPFYNCRVSKITPKPGIIRIVNKDTPTSFLSVDKLEEYIKSTYAEYIGVGELEGEKCNRDGCDGIIEDAGKTANACYCHAGNAPCGYCTEQNQYCPKCGWEAENA